MLYADRFSGHLDSEDPRTPVTAAVGCTWPTIPAYKYRILCPNAYGDWTFLSDPGILLTYYAVLSTHDYAQWWGNLPAHNVDWAYAHKTRRDNPFGYKWEIRFKHTDCAEAMGWDIFNLESRCNVDVELTDVDSDCDSLPGGSGDAGFMRQVEHDKTQPPS